MAEILLRPTCILRNNSGMIRDCWFEPDAENTDEEILVLRQLTSEGNGAVKEKQFRLIESEWHTLGDVIESRRDSK